MSKFFQKGSYIAVDGRMESRSYEKNGIKRKIWEVMVNNASFCEGRKEMPTPKTEAPPVYYEVPDEEEMPF